MKVELVMWIKLLPPFGDGQVWNKIGLPVNATVGDLLRKLNVKHFPIKALTPEAEEEGLQNFILIRDGNVLGIFDTLGQEDRIVVVLPVEGG